MGSGRVPRWVWLVLIGVHVLALSWALSKGAWNFPDSGRYLQAAENLRIHGQLYARPWPAKLPQGQAVQEFTIRPLGYPLAVLGLGGLAYPALLLGVQNVLSLLNLGLVLAWWARWAHPKTRHWVWAVAVTVAFPAQFIYANAVMSEMLLQTAVIALAWATVRFVDNQRPRYFLGIAGALLAALLLKPVFYPLVMVLAGVGSVLAWRHKRLQLALVAVLPLALVVLYMGWNWQRTGYFHFSSIAEINLLHYNAAGVVRQTAGPAAEEQWVGGVLREANEQPNFSARQRLIKTRARAVLMAHPGVYAQQHVQGMGALFLDPGRFDISQFLKLDAPAGGGLLMQARTGSLLRALHRLPLGLLSLLAVVALANVARLVLAVRGFRRLKTGGPVLHQGRWVALGLLFYVALLTGPLGAARFLVPVWPLLLGLALAGLQGGEEHPAQSAPKEAGAMGES
ncbi:MAG: hypothetical protein NVSMB30_17530 [Hymenobacter sp.]